MLREKEVNRPAGCNADNKPIIMMESVDNRNMLMAMICRRGINNLYIFFIDQKEDGISLNQSTA